LFDNSVEIMYTTDAEGRLVAPMPLERLTMLVLPREGEATLVVPRLEAPRVAARPDVFRLHPWDETDDPVAIRLEWTQPR
jgi:hypothetical protein